MLFFIGYTFGGYSSNRSASRNKSRYFHAGAGRGALGLSEAAESLGFQNIGRKNQFQNFGGGSPFAVHRALEQTAFRGGL
jgi:hypothetical protein